MPRSRSSPPHWTATPTAASASAAKALKVVDGLISFIGDNRGNPGANQRSLYVAAVAFSYAVWEAYVEDLAVELATKLSAELDPAQIDDAVRSKFTNQADAWSLTVHPGWRQLWIDRVTEQARGTEQSFGLNTASRSQVRKLFGWVGIDPFDGVDGVDIDRLDELVRLRGEVVHTATVPAGLNKAATLGWRDYVASLYTAVDAASRKHAAQLLGRSVSGQ